MGKLKLKKWDVVEHLESDEDMAIYLEAAFEEAGDDPAFITKVLGEIARARGMSQLARDTEAGKGARDEIRAADELDGPECPILRR